MCSKWRLSILTPCRLSPSSEHAILVDIALRHSLPDIPELRYSIALESKDVDDSAAAVCRLLAYTKKDCNVVAVL
jgi:hypothetical protein